MAAVIMAVTGEVAMAAVIMAVTEEVAMAAVMMVATGEVAMAAVIMVATGEVAMAAVIMDLIAQMLINLLEQKVGKIEVMEIHLIILNMKMVGAEEKGECPMRTTLQTRQISNPFL
jgi:hypothetical protein